MGQGIVLSAEITAGTRPEIEIDLCVPIPAMPFRQAEAGRATRFYSLGTLIARHKQGQGLTLARPFH